MRAVRALVVDDETLARRRLLDLLHDHPQVEVVGEAVTGAEALGMWKALKPDLVFLDIQMPEMDGLDVLKQMSRADRPEVVFATAHDAYAVAAFEEHAVDYLLKPITADRLRVALERVFARLDGERTQPTANGIERLLNDLERASSFRTRFGVRSKDRFVVVDVGDVAYIEAADNYVRMHTETGAYLYRSTMSEMERSLDPKQFLRIHRSLMIRIDRVRVLEPWGLGEYSFMLAGGKKLVSSRSYCRQIREAFGI
jgi:two-component system, LytTR family, response regulator